MSLVGRNQLVTTERMKDLTPQSLTGLGCQHRRADRRSSRCHIGCGRQGGVAVGPDRRCNRQRSGGAGGRDPERAGDGHRTRSHRGSSGRQQGQQHGNAGTLTLVSDEHEAGEVGGATPSSVGLFYSRRR